MLYKIETTMIITYHNHHTFVEQLFGNKNPKYVIQEGTTEEYCTHLINTTLQISLQEKFSLGILMFLIHFA